MSEQQCDSRIAKVRAKMAELTKSGPLRFLSLTPATLENIEIVSAHQDRAAFINCELCAFSCFITTEGIAVINAGAIALCSGCFDVLGSAGAWAGPHVQTVDVAVLAFRGQEN